MLPKFLDKTINKGVTVNEINLVFGLLILFVCVSHIYLSAWASKMDSFLTVKDMLSKGCKKGLPFIWHMGMWGDVFIVSPIMVIGAFMYCNTWSGDRVAIVYTIGGIVSAVMHQMYVAGGKEVPEAHAHSGRLTGAGFLHMLFMSIALAELILLFFFTPHVDHWFAVTMTVGLGIHIFLGNHFLLGLFDKFQWFGVNKWCGRDYLYSTQGWITVLVCWILLGWRCYVMIR